MPFTSDDLGGVNDAVTLQLGGDELLIAESYDVRMSWFRQPSVFALRTGWGGATTELLERYPENTPFELHVAGRLQFTGRIDEVEVEQSSGASEVTFKGRDDLAPLHDATATADRSFENDNFDDLVSKLLTAAGVENFTLIFENDANRNRKTGVDVNASASTGRKVFGRQRASTARKKAGQLRAGESYYGFLKKELDRAGLFLFAAANNTFVIAEPSSRQAPVARLVRQRGLLRNEVTVLRARFRKSATKRFCEAVVHGRGGGGKFGQQPVTASFRDNEMIELGYPKERVTTIKDDKVSSAEQALFLAKKAIADGRREGWSLSYTVSGHSVPALAGRSKRDRAVWCVDSVVSVADDELGIYEPLWISDVTLARDGGGTRSELTLVRVDDLVTGSGP